MSTQIDSELRRRVVGSICALLPQVLRHELPGVSEQTGLMELDLTSASTLELLLAVEDELEIQIDVEEFDEVHLQTVATLADYVAGHAVG
ncbi:acyl carrier protein [Catellatospora sp. KI3]|uniref:acyl carrier protein n=1 Tax=Catellatospora sp. KI3 TaxID=3041620 RepID=UPI002482E34E|nr:acyl carrier protein [Catellatospora sp. KI3]MDI1463580.1 acyl carrier protein [Catellatospora sp. KI3]